MHNNSRLLFEKYALPYFSAKDKVLELGAHIPSHFLLAAERSNVVVSSWEYADIVSSRSDPYRDKIQYLMSDEYTVDAQDESFDVVFSAQVLEHVRKPWVWMRELARLVKPGGYVITISPVSWPYHEAPVDCWRAHPEGMRALLESSGLTVALCSSECLETKKKFIPGKGMDFPGVQPRFLSRVLSVFGWPVEASIDLISIGRKT